MSAEAKTSIQEGTIVKVKETDQLGVVEYNPFGDVFPNEIYVSIGKSSFCDLTLTPEDLEETGQTYAPYIDSARSCGASEVSKSCPYLGVGGDGYKCLRFSEAGFFNMLRAEEENRTLPSGLFPVCQTEMAEHNTQLRAAQEADQ